MSVSPSEGADVSAARVIDRLIGFIEELRSAGIPVSMVEAIDAATAVRHIDLGDRRQVKHTLGATLVKHARHWSAFETAFEVYFGLAPSPVDEELQVGSEGAAVGVSGAGAGAGSGGGTPDLTALADALFRALRDDDANLLGAVVRAAVMGLAGMEPGRPVGGTYYLYRVLRSLDLDEIRARVLEALSAGAAIGGLAARLTEEEVDLRLEAFKAELRSEIRRRLVADRGAADVARTLRRPLVEDLDLTTATREELAEIERVVHPLSRSLAVRLAQRRRRGRTGRLDVRGTLRRSLSSGGVPVDPRFRKPRPGKPDMLLLCDISGSVSTFARFTMQLVHAISSQFSRVRSFAFIDAIDEVTGFFGPGADFSNALARVGTEARVVWLDGHSDYGAAFGAFADRHLEGVTPSTTVIITGDARTNYHDPNLAALRRIAESARALYWLNPERRAHWDTGDSVMSVYAAVCDGVHEVRNLRQLGEFVERAALPVHRPVRRVV